MPRVGSWNGKWTGEGNLFAKVINYTQMYGTSKTAKETAESILIEKNFSYDFGDGWASDIEVRKVTSAEARKLRKDSKGFCGYDWMIDDIINHGRICG